MPARVFTILVILLVAGWAAWPYGSLWFFGKSVDNGNAERLEAMVDWQSVRDHLKGDVRRALSARLGDDGEEDDSSESIARGALMLLGRAIADGLIDAYADPQGLLSVLQELADAGEKGEGRFRDTVSYAFFAAPTRFRVHVKPAGSGEGAPLVLIYSFRDFNWILTRIKLPLDELDTGPRDKGPGARDKER